MILKPAFERCGTMGFLATCCFSVLFFLSDLGVSAEQPKLVNCVAAAERTPQIRGVNRTNLAWRKNADAILGAIAETGIRDVRLSLTAPYEKTFASLRIARELGLRPLLTVGLGQEAFFGREARRRSGKGRFGDKYRLSQIDEARFAHAFRQLIERIESDQVQLRAVQLGNEINWSDFNGDFPVQEKGEGRLYTHLEELRGTPDGERIIEGFRRYARLAASAKAILRQSANHKDAPLISSGLFSASREMTVGSGGTAVSRDLALALMRSGDAFRWLDGIGVHLYPVPVGSGDSKAQSIFDAVRSSTEACARDGADNQPCWITEWGFPRSGEACDINDTDRLENFQTFLRSLQCLAPHRKIAATYLYDWDDHPLFSIFRCNRLLPSGRILTTE